MAIGRLLIFLIAIVIQVICFHSNCISEGISAIKTDYTNTEQASSATAYTEPISGMEFILVPGGCYQMGDSFNAGDYAEKPLHKVCVGSFYIGKYEVTRGEYMKLTGKTPSYIDNWDRYPVEEVSWNDVQDFIHIMNAKSGKFFRLPTEAEWEYAARSGGKKEKYAGSDDIETVAWYDGNSEDSTHPVGSKSPNALGIYDMSGNVWEWCQDLYDTGYYKKSPKINPSGSRDGFYRVMRGGSWDDDQWSARAAHRSGFSPSAGSKRNSIGFRLALPIQRQ